MTHMHHYILCTLITLVAGEQTISAQTTNFPIDVPASLDKELVWAGSGDFSGYHKLAKKRFVPETCIIDIRDGMKNIFYKCFQKLDEKYRVMEPIVVSEIITCQTPPCPVLANKSVEVTGSFQNWKSLIPDKDVEIMLSYVPEKLRGAWKVGFTANHTATLDAIGHTQVLFHPIHYLIQGRFRYKFKLSTEYFEKKDTQSISIPMLLENGAPDGFYQLNTRTSTERTPKPKDGAMASPV